MPEHADYISHAVPVIDIDVTSTLAKADLKRGSGDIPTEPALILVSLVSSR